MSPYGIKACVYLFLFVEEAISDNKWLAARRPSLVTFFPKQFLKSGFNGSAALNYLIFNIIFGGKPPKSVSAVYSN